MPSPAISNVVPPPPAPPPAPGPMPSPFMKLLPLYLKVGGLIVSNFGVVVQTVLLPNSDFLAQYPNAANIPGITAIIVGIIVALLGTPVANANTKKLEDVIDHKDAVIDHKDAVIANKGIEIAVVAAAPPVAPEGQDQIKNAIAQTMILCLQTPGRMPDFDVLTAAYKNLKGGHSV